MATLMNKKNSENSRRRAASARPPAALSLADYLPYHLTVTSDLVGDELARRLQEATGLNQTEWRVMAVIGSFGPMSTRNVAAYTTINKVRVSRALSRLVDMGYVMRESDPHDQRLLKLGFSAQGRKVYAVIAAEAAAWESQLLEPFSNGELALLGRLLARLRRRVAECTPAEARPHTVVPDALGVMSETLKRPA